MLKNPNIIGQWESARGARWNGYFEFLESGRYRMWEANRYKPADFTGRWIEKDTNSYVLEDCNKGSISLLINNIDTISASFSCGYFGNKISVNFKKINTKEFFSYPIKASIDGRNIIITISKKQHLIRSGMSLEKFQNTMCDLEITSSIELDGKEDVEVLYVTTPEGDTLFHTFPNNGIVAPIIVNSSTLKTDKGIHVGSTLDDVKAVYRDVTFQRSDEHNEIIGRAGDLLFSLGKVPGMMDLLPGKTEVKEIIL